MIVSHARDYRRIGIWAAFGLLLAALLHVSFALQFAVRNIVLKDMISSFRQLTMYSVSVTFAACLGATHYGCRDSKWAYRLLCGILAAAVVACIGGALQFAAAQCMPHRKEMDDLAFVWLLILWLLILPLNFSSALASAAIVSPWSAIKRSVRFTITRPGIQVLLVVLAPGVALGMLVAILPHRFIDSVGAVTKTLIPVVSSILMGILVWQHAGINQRTS